MKAKPLMFAKGVTFFDLNQFNHALKNDYINNLVSTAFKVFPLINPMIDKIRVVRGFVSDAHAKAMGLNDPLFTSGLAIEFTWEEYNPEQAIVMFKTLMPRMAVGYELVIKPESVIIYSNESERILSQEIKGEAGVLKREVSRL